MNLSPSAASDRQGTASTWWPSWLDPVLTALGGAAMFVLGFGDLSKLSRPLGGGDLLPAYAIVSQWSQGAPFGNASFGFPFGQRLLYWPTADHLLNAVGGVVGALTGNPVLGTHAMLALSFPATALAALWVLRIAGLRGPIAVTMALAYTAIPYHWFRLDHIYLGTMFSMTLGVGLSLLVATGWVERRLRAPRRWRAWLALLALAFVIAGGGIYYACFTILLCVVAVLYRFGRGARLRDGLVAMIPTALVAVMLGAALVPSILFNRSHPVLEAVAPRIVWESVEYTGQLAFALVPVPITQIPGLGGYNDFVSGVFEDALVFDGYSSGVHFLSNFGSFATVGALVLWICGAVAQSRRTARGLDGSVVGRRPASGASFGMVTLLVAACLAFFVPWGLNYIFAVLVTPQLRGWDRILPAAFALVFAGAALGWRALGLPRFGVRAVVVAGVCLVVVALDSVMPYRANFETASANAATWSVPAAEYATALNAAVPERCGVLQLPYVAYPEVPPVYGVESYTHFITALANPEKNWSYGAMKGTGDSAWMAALGDVSADDADRLARGGFCAVHVDRRGYADGGDAIVAQLTALLGDPVATAFDGYWVAFRLPEPSGPSVDPTDPASLSDEDKAFWLPAHVSTSDTSVTAESDWTGRRWWTSDAATEFAFRAVAPDAPLRAVSGTLRAADCAGQTVTVTLRAPDVVGSTTVVLDPAGEADFSLHLAEPRTAARLTVDAADGAMCAAADGRPRAVALVDPR